MGTKKMKAALTEAISMLAYIVTELTALREKLKEVELRLDSLQRLLAKGSFGPAGTFAVKQKMAERDILEAEVAKYEKLRPLWQEEVNRLRIAYERRLAGRAASANLLKEWKKLRPQRN